MGDGYSYYVSVYVFSIFVKNLKFNIIFCFNINKKNYNDKINDCKTLFYFILFYFYLLIYSSNYYLVIVIN